MKVIENRSSFNSCWIWSEIWIFDYWWTIWFYVENTSIYPWIVSKRWAFNNDKFFKYFWIDLEGWDCVWSQIKKLWVNDFDIWFLNRHFKLTILHSWWVDQNSWMHYKYIFLIFKQAPINWNHWILMIRKWCIYELTVFKIYLWI